MRKFIVSVNGTSYEVEVEEVGAGPAAAPVQAQRPQAAQPAAPKPQAAQAPKTQPKAESAPKTTSVPAGATTVTAPMPGTILDIKVTVGAEVKRGDVLCILEAMKMENEIMSPADGKVLAINTSKGASVSSGDVLVSIG